MRALKDAMFVSLGVVGTLAYQKYGCKMKDVMEDMLENKIDMLKKMDDKAWEKWYKEYSGDY